MIFWVKPRRLIRNRPIGEARCLSLSPKWQAAAVALFVGILKPHARRFCCAVEQVGQKVIQIELVGFGHMRLNNGLLRTQSQRMHRGWSYVKLRPLKEVTHDQFPMA